MSKHELHHIRLAMYLLEEKLKKENKIQKINQKREEDYLRLKGKQNNKPYLHYITIYLVYFNDESVPPAAYPAHAYIFDNIEALESFMNAGEFHERIMDGESPVIWQFHHDAFINEFPNSYAGSKQFTDGWARRKVRAHVEMKPVYSMIDC